MQPVVFFLISWNAFCVLFFFVGNNFTPKTQQPGCLALKIGRSLANSRLLFKEPENFLKSTKRWQEVTSEDQILDVARELLFSEATGQNFASAELSLGG